MTTMEELSGLCMRTVNKVRYSNSILTMKQASTVIKVNIGQAAYLPKLFFVTNVSVLTEDFKIECEVLIVESTKLDPARS